MALSIFNTPQQASNPTGYVSAHEEVWHIVESSNKTEPGFKYLFDIYDGSDLLTRVTTSPYPGSGFGILNVGNIVRSKLQTNNIGDLNFSGGYSLDIPVINAGNEFWFTEYNIQFGEVSGNTQTGDPLILDNLGSGTYRVYNTYNRHPIHDAGARLSSGTVFLTNRPDNSNFYEDEPLVFSINSKRLAAGQTLNIKVGTLDPITGLIVFSNKAVTTFDGMHYFSINGLNKDGIVNIETSGTVLATKNVKKRCSKYKPYTLIFLNAYGGFDSFTFINGNIITDNEKKRFEQMQWQLNGFSMTNRLGKVRYEGMKTYATKFKTKMKLTSDLLNTDEYKWLFELIVSPLVYLWDKDASLLHPVQITDSNYEMKSSLKNKAEFIEVNIDVYDQNTQYR